MSDNELLHKLFEVIELYVFSAGGDGDGWIISERYKEIADEFEAYASKEWKRHDENNHVSFSQDQEAILFVDDRSQLPSWAGDIVVEIY